MNNSQATAVVALMFLFIATTLYFFESLLECITYVLIHLRHMHLR